MLPRCGAWSGLAVVLACAAPVHAATCAEQAALLASRLMTSRLAMDAEGAVRGVLRDAGALVQRCPDEEAASYLQARAAELLADPAASGLSEAAARRFPRSARLATIRARRSGTVDDARAAAALDPAWRPAQVALVTALLQSGDGKGALAAAEAVANPAQIVDANLVLARARLAAGDAKGALTACGAARGGSGIGLVEASLPALERRLRTEALVVEGQALLAIGKRDQGVLSLLDAAGEGSAAARALLDEQRVALSPLLTRLARKRQPPSRKALLRELLQR